MSVFINQWLTQKYKLWAIASPNVGKCQMEVKILCAVIMSLISKLIVKLHDVNFLAKVVFKFNLLLMVKVFCPFFMQLIFHVIGTGLHCFVMH